jgi:hypothetical protein
MFKGKKPEEITVTDLDKESGKEMCKYFGWVFLVGCGIAKAAQHFANAANCKLVSGIMKEQQKEENSGKTE